MSESFQAPQQQVAPAGWYPDPQGSGQQRYWDGTAWTNSFMPVMNAVAVRPAATPSGQPVSDKSRLAALLLAIFLGLFGVHSFYVGKVGVGIAQIAISVCTLFVFSWVWPLVDIILIAAGSYKDARGRVVYNWEA